MLIGVAEEQQVPEIARLRLESEEYHAKCDPFFIVDSGAIDIFERELRGQMKQNNVLVVVATEGGAVVAYLLARIVDSPPAFRQKTFGYISGLVVASDWCRKGIGSQILKRALEWFDERGIRRIHTAVLASNEPATAFWRAHGFNVFTNTLYSQKS